MHLPVLSRRTLLQSGSFAALTAMAQTVKARDAGDHDDEEIVKLVFILRRLPHLSLEEFHRHWKNKHAQLVMKYAEQTRILRYTQSHTLSGNALRTALGNRPDGRAERQIEDAPFDGIAELWWRTTDLSVFDKPAGQEAVKAWLEDEHKFVDVRRYNLWWTIEHVIVDAT